VLHDLQCLEAKLLQALIGECGTGILNAHDLNPPTQPTPAASPPRVTGTGPFCGLRTSLAMGCCTHVAGVSAPLHTVTFAEGSLAIIEEEFAPGDRGRSLGDGGA
jgi:hypothetical protein